MASKVTTLFIEDTAIRMLVARGKHAEKWASVPLEPGLVKHGQVQDKVKLAEKLKETFRWAKIGNKVILGISEPGSLYRIITLPKLPDSILPEAVKRESERVIPLPQDEIYIAYQIISNRGEEMQLFLAAFSRNTVDTLISTLQAAGIKPLSLDLVPLALCRTINKSTAVVVSLRASNFEIAIMVDNVPQVIRSLSLPGEEESLVDKLPTIAEELERTVTFYNSSHADKPIDKNVTVFVDGELAQVPDSWPVLVGNMGNTVTPLPSLIQSEKEFDAGPFTVNIGLALKVNPKETSGSIINFNALPKAYLPEKTKASRVIWPIAAGVAILILALIWLQIGQVASDVTTKNSEAALTQKQITSATADLASVNTQVTQTQSQISPLQAEVTTTQALATAFAATINNLSSERTDSDTTLSQIQSLLPGDVELTSISLNTIVTIVGASPSYSSIFSYAKALTGSSSFNNVNINSITRVDTVAADGTTSTTYNFQISAGSQQ